MRDGDHRKQGIADLPPDLVIEQIFNPQPSNEEGQFTYIPIKPPLPVGDMTLEKPVNVGLSGKREGVRQDSGDSWKKDGEEESGGEVPVIGREIKNGWLRGRKERRDMREKERERLRVVTA